MFVNLTPHPVTLQAADGSRFTVPPSGNVARISSIPGACLLVEACDGFPAGVAVHAPTQYGEPAGLPDPDPRIYYIVSALFAGRVGRRTDVLYPGTGPAAGAVRDGNGQVVAVTRLVVA
jgi:hypothetical protein